MSDTPETDQATFCGKFANSTWYLSRANSPTTSGLAARTPINSRKFWRCVAQSRAGSTFASQSTSCPSIANSRASNAPMTAVQSVISRMYGRRPAEDCHRKAKNVRGGVAGLASG